MSDHDDLELWALDALDIDELRSFDARIDSDGALASAADRLRLVVAAMGEDVSAAAPASVRDRVLGAAGNLRPSRLSRPASSPIETFLHQVAAFDATIEQLAHEQWQAPARPYDWSVHGLLAHLLQIERYMSRVLGISQGEADPHERDHLRFGAAGIADELLRSPQQTFESWRAAVGHTVDRLEGLDLEAGVVFHQYPFQVRTLLVARSFELWTHADDVRRAVGESLASPIGPDVQLMSDTSVGSLPRAIRVVTDRVPDGSARLVLTGDGGGVWDLQLGGGGPELVSIVADAVDYCRLAARRIAPSDLVAEIDGDIDLARLLMAASAVVAV